MNGRARNGGDLVAQVLRAQGVGLVARLDGRVARDHDDLRAGGVLLHEPKHVDPARAAHLHVGDEDAERLLLQPVDGGLAVGEDLDLEAFLLQRWPQPVSDPLKEAPLSEDATYQDTLIFAAKSEQTAVDFYTALSKAYSTHPLGKMWADFARMEQGHKLKLEKEYDDVVLKDN